MKNYAWLEPFLITLRETGIFTKACRAAGVRRADVHRAMSQDEDLEANISEAIAQWAEKLEEAAFTRAVDGVDTPLTNAKGEVIGVKTTYSDTLLIEMLRAHKAELFGKKVEVNSKTPFIVQVQRLTDGEDDLC